MQHFLLSNMQTSEEASKLMNEQEQPVPRIGTTCEKGSLQIINLTRACSQNNCHQNHGKRRTVDWDEEKRQASCTTHLPVLGYHRDPQFINVLTTTRLAKPKQKVNSRESTFGRLLERSNPKDKQKQTEGVVTHWAVQRPFTSFKG